MRIIVIISHTITMIIVCIFLLLDIFGYRELSGLNFTFLLIFAIFTIMVFGEVVLKNLTNEKSKKIRKH